MQHSTRPLAQHVWKSTRDERTNHGPSKVNRCISLSHSKHFQTTSSIEYYYCVPKHVINKVGKKDEKYTREVTRACYILMWAHRDLKMAMLGSSISRTCKKFSGLTIGELAPSLLYFIQLVWHLSALYHDVHSPISWFCMSYHAISSLYRSNFIGSQNRRPSYEEFLSFFFS